jgi:hypothetical protein
MVRTSESHITLAYGSVTIALCSSDPTVLEWLMEVLEPCFTATTSTPRPDWCVRISAVHDAFVDLSAWPPREAAPRACFALDQEVLSFPTWPVGDAVAVADVERSCLLTLTPRRVELLGDARTRRWRFTAMWVCHEIAATRLRGTHLDVHAASVEAAGQAVLIVGPKGAGKTTLSLHLLRSGGWRMMANDRAFVGREEASVVGRGLPTAVKVRPPTLAEFPELRRGLPSVDRPYLHTLDELAKVDVGIAAPETSEFALSPAQLAHQLRVERHGAAPLGAILFPEVRADMTGWAADRLPRDEVARRLLTNLYGGPPGRRGATVFEDFDGDRNFPGRAVADEIVQAIPGYRLTMSPRAYAEPGFGERFRAALVAL